MFEVSCYSLDEGQRQAVLLGLARLACERPGWVWFLGELAERFHGRAMFDQFRELTADLPNSLADCATADIRPGPDGTMILTIGTVSPRVNLVVTVEPEGK